MKEAKCEKRNIVMIRGRLYIDSEQYLTPKVQSKVMEAEAPHRLTDCSRNDHQGRTVDEITPSRARPGKRTRHTTSLLR